MNIDSCEFDYVFDPEKRDPLPRPADDHRSDEDIRQPWPNRAHPERWTDDE